MQPGSNLSRRPLWPTAQDYQKSLQSISSDFELADELFSDTDSNATYSDLEEESQNVLLNFADKISKELSSHFRRNADKDGFCEDIYEDKFSTPKSGSYSYYTDLLAMAQMSEQQSLADHSGNSDHSLFKRQPSSLTLKKQCDWMCNGRLDISMGAGPLEHLFSVLDPSDRQFLFATTPTQSFETAADDRQANVRVEGECLPLDGAVSDSNLLVDSNILDVLHHWTSDKFSSSHTASELNDFHSFDDY